MASGSAEAWRNVAPMRGTAGPFAAGLAAPRLSDRVRRPLAHRRPFPRRDHNLRLASSMQMAAPGRSVDRLAVRPLRWALWLRSMMRPRSEPSSSLRILAPPDRVPAPVRTPTSPQLRSVPSHPAATGRQADADLTVSAGTPRGRRMPSSLAPPAPLPLPVAREASPLPPLGSQPSDGDAAAARPRAGAAGAFAFEHASRRPLPTPFVPLARAITGSASVPRLATGARSREALRTAGAPAATVGRTIHMDRAPDPASPRALGVVAHELVHVAASSAATSAPQRRLNRARPADPTAPRTAPPREVSPPRFFGDALVDAVEGRAGGIGSRVESLARSGVGAVSSAADRARGAASDTIASVGRSASTLPVSGPGAVMGVAQEAVATVRQEAAEVMSGLESARAQATATAGEMGDQFAGSVDEVRSAATGALERPAAALSGAASSLAGQAGSATEAAGSALGSIASAAQSAAQDAQSQLGDLIEAIEERVLGELERRGGRYAGVF